MVVGSARHRLGLGLGLGRGVRRALLASAILALALVTLPGAAQAVSPNIVISQVYGGGGNTGAPFTNDYVELFNRGTTAASLSGWSLQYTSATGTGNLGASSAQLTELPAVSLAPGQYLLVQEASTAAVGAPLPAPDVTDPSPINMSATGGKVALVSTTTPLGCNGSSTPCPPSALAQIVDLVGYDGANFFEGSGPAPAASNTAAVLRAAGGCTDSDDNAADFSAAAPSPRNTASPQSPCPANQPVVANCDGPLSTITGVPAGTQVSASDADGRVISIAITGVTPSPAPGSIFRGSLVPAAGTGGTATAGITVDAGTPAGSYAVTVAAQNDDPEPQSATCTLTVNVVAPTPIHDVQGAGHLSPKSGQIVAGARGVVTARASNGFWFQDPSPDTQEATSEGLFVFTSTAPTVSVGDLVQVSGRVAEFRPGGDVNNLTTTELTGPSVSVVSSGNPLPAATVVGSGGRVPPAEVIEDDATGNVETSGTFDPSTDGVDFYESLEGMRLQLSNAVAVGPRSSFGEVPVVGDDGANAAVRTGRGGVVVRPGDFNPERVFLDDALAPTPAVNVGDHLPGAVVGVMDYSFGNYKLQVTSTPGTLSGGLAREVTAPVAANQLAVATFNVENLDPTDPPSKFGDLAGLIVSNLEAPDLIAVEEIQDDNGATNDAVVDADVTFGRLISAIQAAGGPVYDFRQISPVDDQDGGEPGGNIRVGFLFRSDRGLSFIDRPGGTSTAATTVVGTGADARLSFSPGRIDPTNSAFNASRKPLAGELTFNGRHLFVVANHFNSKGGDQPLFGRFQPPTRGSEVQRQQQAQVVHDFAAGLEAADPDANVIVLGDLNDFEFSAALATLRAGVLHDLIETLPQSERYTYDFEGNSQALDHILLSDALFQDHPFAYDAVHVNAEFAVQASDHDPQVARLTLDPPYDFAGFFQPVDNLPVLNQVSSGRAVPVRFSLHGDQGLDVLAAGYPRSERIACGATDPVDAVEETVAAGSSGLSYDPVSDTYTYVWRTDKAWAGTCRQLVVKLDDGTSHRANFKLTR
jgi:predicted extracellular nuclease